LKDPEFRSVFSLVPLHFAKEMLGGMIVVGAHGKRFADEKRRTLHGRIKTFGQWARLPTPCPMFMIVDHVLCSAGPLYGREPRSNWNPIVEAYEWSKDNTEEALERAFKAGVPALLNVIVDKTPARTMKFSDYSGPVA
jgi:hypothetical protein